MSTYRPVPKLKLDPFFVIPGLATEQGQAVVRLGWTLLFALYLLLSGSQQAPSLQLTAAWWLIGTHFVFAVVMLVSQHLSKRDNPLRRTLALVFDQGLFAALLYFTAEIAAPFVLVPLFFTFGAGLRYGRTYAVFSKVLGAGLTFLVLMSSTYWEQYSSIRVGLALATIYLPLYVFRLTDAIALDMRTDSLTRLRNRVGFDELLNAACQNAQTANLDGAVVLIDLDGFKRVNDEQGHDGGDVVLKHVGYWLSKELSPFGVPARFGGDEFAVVVEGLTSRTELEAALARFLARIAEVGKLFASPLGASIGVFYLERAATVPPRSAFKAADQLMYRAKELGKNQFVTSAGSSFTIAGDLIQVSNDKVDASVPTMRVARDTQNIDRLDDLVRSQL